MPACFRDGSILRRTAVEHDQKISSENFFGFYAGEGRGKKTFIDTMILERFAMKGLTNSTILLKKIKCLLIYSQHKKGQEVSGLFLSALSYLN